MIREPRIVARAACSVQVLLVLLGTQAGGCHGLCVERKGQHHHRDRYRQIAGREDDQGRPAAARHRVDQGREVRPGRGRRRRHDPDDRYRHARDGRDPAVRARSRAVHAGSDRQDALRRQRERQHRHDHRHREARAARRGAGRRRAGRHGHQPRRQDPGQHLRNDQHGAFHRSPRRARSSPMCWSTRGRASRSSSPTARSSGYRPRSAAR